MLIFDELLEILYRHVPPEELDGKTLDQFKADAHEANVEDPVMGKLLLDLANEIWQKGYDAGATNGTVSSLL